MSWTWRTSSPARIPDPRPATPRVSPGAYMVSVMAIVRPNSVLPDANIWCSATLHSWFGLIATESIGSWTFYWTEDILAEAMYHRASKRRRSPRARATFTMVAKLGLPSADNAL